MFLVFFRVIILYGLTIFCLRFMGKRQLGELQPTEFVITIMISNIATMTIENTSVPLASGLVPILVLICLEVIISVAAIKNRKVRKLVSGNPLIVIRNGVLDQNTLQELRFSIDDLMEALRGQNIFDIRDVEFAVVETNGIVNIFKKAEKQGVTPEMLQLQTMPCGPQVVLVSDGELIEDGLDTSGMTRDWFDRTLVKEQRSVRDIFIMTCNNAGDYHIIPKQ